MPQYELSLRDYLRILNKRKHIILVTAILGAIVAWALTGKEKPEYEATSSIRVNRMVTPTGLYVQMLNINEANDIATHMVRLTSRHVLLAAAYKVEDRDLLPAGVRGKLEQQVGKPVDDASDWAMDLRDINEAAPELEGLPEAIDNLQRSVAVQPKSSTNIIDIRARWGESDSAIKFANAIADVYELIVNDENNSRVNSADSVVAVRLQESRAKLVAAVTNLNQYHKAQFNQVNVATNFGALMTLREELAARQAVLEDQVKQLRVRENAPRGGELIEFVSGDVETRTLQKLNAEAIDLQLEKQRLLVYMKPEAPAVVDVENKIRGIVGSLRRELEADKNRIAKRIADLDNTMRDVPTVDADLSEKRRKVEALSRVVERWEKAADDLQLRKAEKPRTVNIEQHASSAQTKKKASKFAKAAAGLVIGVVIGFILALTMEVLDTSIDTIDDVETFLEVPVIGIVPHIDLDEMKERMRASAPGIPERLVSDGSALLITQLGPKSASAEAFRTLRTNIEFAMMQNKGKCFAVSSAALGEGKTTVAANLAISMAQNGRRTLLVSADLRRPTLFRMFGLDKHPGLTDVLLGRLDWKEAVKSISDVFLGDMSSADVLRTPGLENLSIITCGAIPSNPSALLSSERTAAMIAEVKENFDAILFDAPPVLPVADAAILGSKVDATILVYQVGKIGRAVLRRAKVQLDNVGAAVMGVVLNDLTSEIAEFKTESQYYRQYYYKEEEPRQPGWLRRAFDSGSQDDGDAT